MEEIVEEIIREPVELTESELDLVAGGAGSAAAAAGTNSEAAGATDAALAIAAVSQTAPNVNNATILIPVFGSVAAGS
jgi:hypothetical protein